MLNNEKYIGIIINVFSYSCSDIINAKKFANYIIIIQIMVCCSSINKKKTFRVVSNGLKNCIKIFIDKEDII